MHKFTLHSLDAKKIYIICILLIVLTLSLLLFYPKNCRNDENCFNTLYEVKGKKGNDCILTIFLKTIGTSQDEILNQMLAQKGMICGVPMDLLQIKNISQINDISDYCTGPLKEAALEIVLEKVYSIVVANIGQITLEYENILSAATMNTSLINNT